MHKLLAGQRMLVVEDEFMVLQLTEDMLGDLGCEFVAAAATVDQALTLIQEQSFDVAMLDMNLDGEKPFAVADALTARNIPFIFATGYVGHDMKEGYRDRPLLKKPYHREQLAAAIAEIVDL